MQLSGLQKAFQSLPIKRQILIQSVGMVALACFLLSVTTTVMIQRHLENELLTIANEEAGNRLDLVETHLRSLEEEVLRIARNTAQLRRHHMELSIRDLRSALIVDLMLHRESRSLIFTDSKGQPTHTVSNEMWTFDPHDVLPVLASGQVQRTFHLPGREYILLVPIKDGESINGAVVARFDFTVVLQHFFQRKNHLLYSFEQKGEAFFHPPGSATNDPTAGTLLKSNTGILRELGIECRYQPYAPDFKRPLHEAVLLLLIISLSLIVLTVGIGVALGHQISQPVQELYGQLIKPEDDFVPSSPNNELQTLSEALAFHEEKNRTTIQELEKSRDEALKATQTKSEFLANMSHEIRAPMNGVLGMAQLIRFTDMTPEQRKYVDAIIDAGDTLMGIINDILDFSKIEAGHFQIDYQDFDLQRCLQSTIQIFEVKAKEKGLQLLLDMRADMPRMIRGDELRLRQILNNLISNAIKFTSKGQVSVHVNLQPQGTRINLQISVHDTGIGIHKDDIGKLFKSFSQANSSITRKFGGTGLGLAISQALCELMGGSIGVESTLGQGSTFYFNLMFEQAQKQTSTPTEKMTEYSRNLRILVADDSDVNQMIVRTMFKKLGIRVDVASDGLEAIEMAAETVYDLIYMDVHMPLKEGPDAARIILAENRFQPPPKIIALTADMFKDDHKKCFEAGMIDLLMKPIQLNDLRTSLQKYGKRAREDHEMLNQAS